MSNRMKYVLGGLGAVLVAWWLLPSWLTTIILVAIIATPVAAYLMLDERQRRRLGRLRNRQLR